MTQRPVIYTPDQAERVIPQLAELFPQLRAARDEVLSTQNKCDVEELTSFGTTGKPAEDAREKMDRYHARIRTLERDFERKLRVVEELGCEVKSLDPGLVDFYSHKQGELIFLCWKEGEAHIGFWHALDAGYAGRQPLT